MTIQRTRVDLIMFDKTIVLFLLKKIVPFKWRYIILLQKMIFNFFDLIVVLLMLLMISDKKEKCLCASKLPSFRHLLRNIDSSIDFLNIQIRLILNRLDYYMD